MLEASLSLLEIFENNGYQAYIVGGFVRDHLLKKSTNDVDICTDATPKEIKEIFDTIRLPKENYGSVTLIYKNIRFEITTFRREIFYVNNRKPEKIEYIDDLLEDLKRRDFTINTICMDKSGKIIDLLDGQVDLAKGEINTVGNSYSKFNEDALRILRAIRFVTILDFKLGTETKEAIIKTKHLLKNISYQRKKEELDKIFTSKNIKYGISLLKELGLDKELELTNLEKVNIYDDLIGIWSILNVTDIYPFTNNEHELIKNINEALKLDNRDPLVLYKYGLYVNQVAASIKGINKVDISIRYNDLIIKRKSDINISAQEILSLLKVSPSAVLRKIYEDLEEKILTKKLDNIKEVLSNYILANYK